MNIAGKLKNALMSSVKSKVSKAKEVGRFAQKTGKKAIDVLKNEYNYWKTMEVKSGYPTENDFNATKQKNQAINEYYNSRSKKRK